MGGRSVLHRAAGAAATLVTAVVIAAAPASGHIVAGATPTKTKAAITTGPPGVRVHLIDLSRRLQLTSRRPGRIIVLGSYAEPYLRLDDTGTAYNARSPTYYANQPVRAGAPVPARPDADIQGQPRWETISPKGHTLSWADKRPLAGGGSHRWVIPLDVTGTRATIAGTTRVVPPTPPWWAWAAIATGVAITVAVIGWAIWRPVAIAGTATLVLAEAAHAVGAAAASPASALIVAARVAFSGDGMILAAWMICCRGLVSTARRQVGSSAIGAVPSAACDYRRCEGFDVLLSPTSAGGGSGLSFGRKKGGTMTKPNAQDAQIMLQLASWYTESHVAEAVNWVRSDEFVGSYRKFSKKFPNGSDGRLMVNRILGHYETVGTLWKNGLINEQLLFDWLWIPSTWDLVKDIALGQRAEVDNAGLWENFEAMAERERALAAAGPSTPPAATRTASRRTAGASTNRRAPRKAPAAPAREARQ